MVKYFLKIRFRCVFRVFVKGDPVNKNILLSRHVSFKLSFH